MEHRPVKSTNILSIGWQDNVLEVRFRSGQLYRWKGVSSIEHGLFLKAKSKGTFLAGHIRQWHGSGVRVKE